MGTTWSVKIAGSPGHASREDLDTAIGERIEALEQSMSTYREDSELSEFNRYQGDDWVPVSPELCEVVEAALAVGTASGGAFDVTIGPVVDLWGFGPGDAREAPPAPEEVQAALDTTGAQFLYADCDRPALRKARPALRVDLSAIAKGYAVDAVSELLDTAGIEDYLVEIGGELKAHGRHPAGRDWSIGIELPDPGGRSVRAALPLADRAVATSGDYRNFFEFEGVRYSHEIDPRTGAPVSHGLAAVTVVAKTAMAADAWATALLVLGPADGVQLAKELGLSALFQQQGLDDVITTGDFAALLEGREP